MSPKKRSALALKKKGLRHAQDVVAGLVARSALALKKKGLRPYCLGDLIQFVGSALALKKKGMRLRDVAVHRISQLFSTGPEEKGIETNLLRQGSTSRSVQH